MSAKKFLVVSIISLTFLIWLSSCVPVQVESQTPVPTILSTPTQIPTLKPTQTQEPTQTAIPATETPSKIPIMEKQIVVILSRQMVYAYEGENLIKEFVVSTGLPDTPTVLGTYTIYIKLDSTRMTGPGYDLPNVPWTMYFYQGYGFHGTYWHSNFGHPMSHGCVNMKTDEAEWLYHWAPVGTSVLILP